MVLLDHLFQVGDNVLRALQLIGLLLVHLQQSLVVKLRVLLLSRERCFVNLEYQTLVLNFEQVGVLPLGLQFLIKDLDLLLQLVVLCLGVYMEQFQFAVFTL